MAFTVTNTTIPRPPGSIDIDPLNFNFGGSQGLNFEPVFFGNFEVRTIGDVDLTRESGGIRVQEFSGNGEAGVVITQTVDVSGPDTDPNFGLYRLDLLANTPVAITLDPAQSSLASPTPVAFQQITPFPNEAYVFNPYQAVQSITITDGGAGTTADFFLPILFPYYQPLAGQAPVATGETFDVRVGQTITGNFLANDTDGNGDRLLLRPEDVVTNVTLGMGSVTNGAFSYTAQAVGTDIFTYRVTDGFGGFASATATFNVLPANLPPSATNDSASTNEDTAVVIGVLGNDSDPDGDPLIVARIVSGPANGSAAINPDNTVTYTPSANFNGSDSFVYEVSDQNGETDAATVNVEVTAVNDGPISVADSYSVDEDNELTVNAANGVLDNDTDDDNDTLSAVLVNDVSNGSLTLNSNGSFNYTPDANFSGSDSFTYKANDGTEDGDTVTATITVNSVNDAPVSVADSYSVDEDNELTVNAANGVLDNDTDDDNDTLSAILVSDVSNGSLTLNSNGSFNYTPDANFSGSDSFTYKADDGTEDGNTVAATITVNSVNDVPVANDDTASTFIETPVLIDVSGNDSDIDGTIDNSTIAIISDPANGRTTIVNGEVRYRPDNNFSGQDSFTYTVADNEGGTSNEATVDIGVMVPLQGDFELVRSWSSGYQAKLEVENFSSEPINAWTLTIDGLDSNGGQVANGWVTGIGASVNKTILDPGSIEFSTVGKSHFDTIDPGESFTAFVNVNGSTFDADSLSFVFNTQAQDAGPAPDFDNPDVGGDDFLEVEPTINSDWGNGFNGRVEVTNISDQPVDDWVITLGFGQDVNLTSTWSANSSDLDGDTWSFEAAGWNRVIAPGQTFSFGFKGNPGGLDDITVEDIMIA